ncbi:MAG: hypothetical protein GWP14_01910 [Actinobacteria bacterium]|nr:hypothetical protein [Actinomycetota bacterium]
MSKLNSVPKPVVVPGGRILRQWIDNGEPLWGFMLTMPAPEILELAEGWDWVWLDGQHGQLSYDTILNCVRVADLMGLPAIVRVAGCDYSQVGQALDTGAAGVIVPMLHNAEQAKVVAEAAKFAPLGRRSYGGRRVMDRFGPNYAGTANKDVLLLGQIESVEGLANAEQITAVPGIDGLVFGPADYSLDCGISLESYFKMSEPHLWQMAEKIAHICSNHGKVAGAFVGSAENSGRWIELGYKMLLGTVDASLLRTALAEDLANRRRASQKS